MNLFLISSSSASTPRLSTTQASLSSLAPTPKFTTSRPLGAPRGNVLLGGGKVLLLGAVLLPTLSLLMASAIFLVILWAPQC